MSDFSSIADVIKDIHERKVIILVDDPNRENEGDLFIPSELVTTEHVNFMLHHARGILCVAIDQTQAHQLGLVSMVPLQRNTENTKVNFAISVNAKSLTSSGVSASDRAQTIRVTSNPEATDQDLTTPGHVFPLIAHPKGLNARQGHTEAAVALATLAGYQPSGVLCEILNEDGTMAKLADLKILAKKFNIKIASIAELREYIAEHPVEQRPSSSVRLASKADLPTKFGDFKIYVFRSIVDGLEHTALIHGELKPTMLTRVHSQCLTGDTFGSELCDCGEQLHLSLSQIVKNKSGILLYLNQEGRGIGLSAKVAAYAKQQTGLDTVEANVALGFKADERDYAVAADMLKHFNITSIDLLSNNPAKRSALEEHGIAVRARVKVESKPTEINRHYLETKKLKMGHQLDLV